MNKNNKINNSLKEDIKIACCSRCGCEGLHACTGSPIIWTEKEIEDFKKAVDKMIKKR